MENEKIRIEDLVGKTVYFPFSSDINRILILQENKMSCEKILVEEYYKTNDLLIEQKEYHNKHNQLIREYMKKIEKFKDGMKFGFIQNNYSYFEPNNPYYYNQFNNNSAYLPDVELVSDDTYNIINTTELYPQPISKIITLSEFNKRWFLDEELAIKCLKTRNKLNPFIDEEED